MFLKHLRLIAVAFVFAFAAVTTSGCSNWFGDKPDEPKPFVKKSDADNLKDVPATLKAWIKDGKADIGGAIDIVAKALDDFSAHVAGRTKDIYTEGELRQFISDYLLEPQSSASGDVDELTRGILKVKQLILGGSKELITKDELARFKSILLRAKPYLVAISPHVPTLLMNVDKASATEVADASSCVAQLFELLASEFERPASGRPETGFHDLLSSAQTVGLQSTSVDTISSWLPLIESLKVLILSGEPDTLRPKEWAPMIRTISRAWALGLSLKYNIIGNPQMLGSDFNLTEAAVRELLSILDASMAAHGGEIPTANFENLIDALAAKQMMPSVNGHYASSATIKGLLPAIFGKLLYGRWHSDFDRQSLRFGPAQLARLKELASDWIGGQQMINASIAKQTTIDISKFGANLASLRVVRKSFFDDTTFQQATRAQTQLMQFVSKGRPPIHDSEGRLIVVTRKELPGFAKWDLDFMNITRVALEAVLTGWTHSAQNAAGIIGMTEAETQEAYMDLRTIGKDFNFIDIRSNQAGTRTFMENAIFMSSSDGNAYMGLQEGVEWFNFVSSGSQIADQMWHDLEKTCRTVDHDVLGNWKLKTSCFRSQFLKTWPQYLPNLPHLVTWARQDGSGKRAASMLTALENAGRNRGAVDDPIDSSEFRSMIPVAHYLESMFARHDVDQNGVLDNNEIWNAFPLLAPFIKKMGQGKADSETMQKTILSYILEFGTVPSTDVSGMLKLGGWYLVHGMFKSEADRTKVLTVIGAFPAAGKASRVRDITAYYKANQDALRQLITRKEPINAARLADLFQCLPDAVPNLANDMRLHSDGLVPQGTNIGADEFISKMKWVIDADPSLDQYCLPF